MCDGLRIAGGLLMSTRLFRAFIVVAALGTAGTLSSGCSTNNGSASKADVGSIGIALQLASGTMLNAVSYTVTGPGNFSLAGTIDTSHSSTVSAVIGNIPA